MRLEAVERRVLGAVRYLDATTGQPVGRLLDVKGQGVRLLRNLRGLYVLAAAPGLEEHPPSFQQPPASPAVGGLTVRLSVADPTGRFLPRTHTLALPREPLASKADQEDSLFRPVDVRLYPAPAASLSPGWAVARVAVRDGAGRPLPGALVRVLRASDSKLLASGLTEWRGAAVGEALVPVAGIPITIWGGDAPDEPVVVQKVPAVAQAFADPFFDPAAGLAPDPDRLEGARAGLPSASKNIDLASGREVVVTLSVTMP